MTHRSRIGIAALSLNHAALVGNRPEGAIDGVIAAVLGHALELCDAEFRVLFEYTPHGGFRAALEAGRIAQHAR